MSANARPKINILLVDDQPANLLALQSLLQHPDYNLVTARSGHDALRAMLNQEFALILLDVIMPGLDGLETAQLLRQRERTTYTPIIFITAASAGDKEVVKGYELGAVDYIFKPIVPEILRAKVQVFVDLYQRAERIKTQAAELRAAQQELRRDLADRLRAEKALRESEEKYRLLFDLAHAAIIVFDKRTRQLMDANEAAAALYGHSRADLLRLSADDLFLDPRTGETAALGLRTNQSRELAATQRTSDGRQFPAEFNHAVFALKGREVVLVLARDVTERRRAEETERLLAREAMQRDFVATVSHELRTPIAAIKGFAETLRLGGLSDAKNRLRFIKIIEKHADKLGWLVEDILTLNAMESGKLKPKAEPFALREFMERLVESLAPIAARREVSVKIEIDPALQAVADAHHATRIFQNLLDNAIKYNVRGGAITIKAADEGRLIHLVVADSGIGIAAHDLPLIFQQFHRSENAKATQVKGSGLGLYIIKSIVESNGGQIWAHSEVGKGSEFHLTIPSAAAPGRAQPASRPEQLAERPQ